jgi:hypothetical protein
MYFLISGPCTGVILLITRKATTNAEKKMAVKINVKMIGIHGNWYTLLVVSVKAFWDGR